MINTRKLIKMARKWQRMAALSRKRISLFPGNINVAISTTDTGCSAPAAEKGHFVVYTADQSRYSFPIAYLNNPIFRELLKMAEEEFGLPSDGPITIPCDAVFMDYLISLIRRRATKDTERAVLLSMASCRCSFVHQQEKISHPTILHAF
ncbi:hypothetical protein ACH5RR_002495 [Cinchona calisaya]|uniref:Uncharacterized protein n=1 Tax=Cinchona calisaya TaxID=153742 RepID=A0ABD3B6H4_9GENT